MNKKKRIVFVSGTRADFGKMKSIILRLNSSDLFEISIFVTGMHLLRKFGFTYDEVKKTGLKNIYKFKNQKKNDLMSEILAKTIIGFNKYISSKKPDLIVIHGDRVETLAGAIVGSLNNILTAHIEGGEVSGTIDEAIRHSVSKLCHLHFVSNVKAKKRLIQLGENKKSIHIIGSPDIDIMNSKDLPNLHKAKARYEINFKQFAIVLFHPVTTELDKLKEQTSNLVKSIIRSNLNYIIIYPNNDNGHDIIFNQYKYLKDNPKIKFFPSLRFEYFLTLLKSSSFILGNSSAGIREAPYFGIPTINIGTRQNKRSHSNKIIHTDFEISSITKAIDKAYKFKIKTESFYGKGNSKDKFFQIISKRNFWHIDIQKYFVDIDLG